MIFGNGIDSKYVCFTKCEAVSLNVCFALNWEVDKL